MMYGESNITKDDDSFLCNIGNFIRLYKPGTEVPTEEVFQGCAKCYSKNMTYEDFCNRIIDINSRVSKACYALPFDMKITNDENDKQRIAWISFH